MILNLYLSFPFLPDSLLKNKHNTVKGSDKVGIYDFLAERLQSEYEGFTAYYVEIIPSSKEPYDIPFTPSDRASQSKRSANEKIRQISGQAFYKLVTGQDNAIEMLFSVIPDVIFDIIGKRISKEMEQEYRKLFSLAFHI